MYICLSVQVYICLSVYLYICLSIYLSVYLSVCLYVNLFSLWVGLEELDPELLKCSLLVAKLLSFLFPVRNWVIGLLLQLQELQDDK